MHLRTARRAHCHCRFNRALQNGRFGYINRYHASEKRRSINGDFVENLFIDNELFVVKIDGFDDAFYGRKENSLSCFFYGIDVRRKQAHVYDRAEKFPAFRFTGKTENVHDIILTFFQGRCVVALALEQFTAEQLRRVSIGYSAKSDIRKAVRAHTVG